MPPQDLTDLLVCLLEQGLVVDVLPDDEAGDDAVQAFAFGLLLFLGGELVRVGGRIVDELGEQHRAAGGERAARPPQVQGGGVAVADGLLAGGLAVDVFQGQGDLDELWLVPELVVGHTGSPPRSHSLAQLPMTPVAAKSPKSTSRNGSTI